MLRKLLGSVSFAFVTAALAASTTGACVGDAASLPADTNVDAGDAGSADPCPTYCDTVLANCTGELRPFDNKEQCLKMCAFMPRGKEGEKQNTVECRLTSAKAGGTKDNCLAASAYGGNVCGSRCDVFCDLVDKNCIQTQGEAAPYKSKSDCVEACQAIPFKADGFEGPGEAPSGANDSLNCRMYHLILSLDDRVNHCPHVAVNSTVCFGAGADGQAHAGH